MFCQAGFVRSFSTFSAFLYRPILSLISGKPGKCPPVQARRSPSGRIDRIGKDSFPYPITAIFRSSRGFAARWSSLSVGAKRTSTGRSAPLPVGCPPVQARRSPSGRIAQKPEVVRNGTASNLSLIENHFIYKIGIFFIPHREIGTPFIIKKAVRKSFCHIRKVKAAAKKPPSADTDQR